MAFQKCSSDLINKTIALHYAGSKAQQKKIEILDLCRWIEKKRIAFQLMAHAFVCIRIRNEKLIKKKNHREKWEKCRDTNWITMIINGNVNCWYIFSNSLRAYFLALDFMLGCFFFVLFQYDLMFVCVFRTFSSSCVRVFFFFVMRVHTIQIEYATKAARTFYFFHLSHSLIWVVFSVIITFLSVLRRVFLYIQPGFFFIHSFQIDWTQSVISFQCIFGWMCVCLVCCLYCYTALRIPRGNFHYTDAQTKKKKIERTNESEWIKKLNVRKRQKNCTETAKHRNYREMNEMNGNKRMPR